MRAVAPEVIAGAGSAVLHVAALLWVGPWDPVVAEAPVEISVIEEPQEEPEPPAPREPRPKPEIRRLPRPHPLVRLARAAEPREGKERDRSAPKERPEPKEQAPKIPEVKPEIKPEELVEPEAKREPREEQAPDPEARGQAGDRLPEQRPEEIRFARTDAAETKIALNSSAVSDRNHIELEETRAPTSTARGLGDGTSQEERIVLYGDRYAEKKDAPQGLKRGQRTRRARAASVAPAPGELGAAGAGTPAERVVIPVVPAEAWAGAQGTIESAGASAGAWLSVQVEAPPPPPTPAVKRRAVRPIPEEARAATVPVPVPEPEVAPPEPERPLFFGDDFMNTWSAPELGGEAALNPGEEVPELLAEAKPERTSTEGAAFSALEVADARLPEGDRTRISTRRDPLGVWAAGLDQQLRERLVYPPELRALGVGGVVKVGFRVLPDGRVVDIEIVSSDVPELVVPAVAAVPERTDPLPPERERQYRRGIRVTYTFRFGEPGR